MQTTLPFNLLYVPETRGWGGGGGNPAVAIGLPYGPVLFLSLVRVEDCGPKAAAEKTNNTTNKRTSVYHLSGSKVSGRNLGCGCCSCLRINLLGSQQFSPSQG